MPKEDKLFRLREFKSIETLSKSGSDIGPEQVSPGFLLFIDMVLGAGARRLHQHFIRELARRHTATNSPAS